MKFLPGLSTLSPTFDALLLDLWGCVHDGSHLYPGALNCIEQAHAAGKKIIFLSNAPRRAAKAQAVLDTLGVPRELYETVVTSGEVAFQTLQRSSLIPHRSSFYFLGAPHDAVVLDGLPFTRVQSAAEADFILNAGFGTEAQSTEDFHAALKQAALRKLPMLCLNPDMEVVKQTGERFPCAGVLAQDYERFGGKVHYFGKPYGQVYKHCLQLLTIPRDRILAIGDGLHTDILGAKRASIASALVTGGILHTILGDASQADMQEFLAKQDIQPDYVLPELVW